jgi:hypothetical protein
MLMQRSGMEMVHPCWSIGFGTNHQKDKASTTTPHRPSLLRDGRPNHVLHVSPASHHHRPQTISLWTTLVIGGQLNKARLNVG